MIGIGGGANNPLDGKFDWFEKTETLKGLPMQMVQLLALSGNDPMVKTLAVGELDRRAKMQRSQMAQMAKPTQTIAEQIVGASMGMPMQPNPGTTMPGQQMQAGIGAVPMGAPAAAPAPAAPVGAPMAEGGALDLNTLLARLLQAGEARRVPQFETFGGAMSEVGNILKPGRERYARAISDYQGDEATRRRWELSQMLLAAGTPMMTATGPDFLGNVGAGMAGLAEAMGNVRTGRDARSRLGIEDAGSLLGLDVANLEHAGNLYEIGAGGLEGVQDATQTAANIRGQLDVANRYASRSGSGSSTGLRSTRGRAAQARLTAATRNLTSARSAVTSLEGSTGLVSDEARARAVTALQRAEQEYQAAQQEMARVVEIEAGLGSLVGDEEIDSLMDAELGPGSASNPTPSPRGFRAAILDAFRRAQQGGLSTVPGGSPSTVPGSNERERRQGTAQDRRAPAAPGAPDFSGAREYRDAVEANNPSGWGVSREDPGQNEVTRRGRHGRPPT